MSNIIRDIIHEYLRNSSKNEDYMLYESHESDLETLKTLVKKVEKKLKQVYLDTTGIELNLPKIEIKLDPNIKNGKIGGFSHPEYNGDNGVLGIKPKALKNLSYLENIITHELIHASIREDLASHKEHSGLFKKLADKMGLPEEYQD